MNNRDKKEYMVFRKTIPANTTIPIVFKERIKGDGTVESLDVRFYIGQQKMLQVNPYIEHKNEMIESLVQFQDDCDQFLAGDDDRFSFNPIIPVENNEQVCVSVINNDPVNDYTLMVTVGVDYYGGTRRVV